MFIGLVVVVVAAVAMVAVGRGDGLAPAVPDRPDVELPTGRPLEAADLADLRLSVTVRGYRMDEVDALLARLAAEIEDRDTHRDTHRETHGDTQQDPVPDTHGDTHGVAAAHTPPPPDRADLPTAGSAPGATVAPEPVQERT